MNRFIRTGLNHEPVYWNRIETEAGFNKETDLGLVFQEKLII
jgi:hypothetical protein